MNKLIVLQLMLLLLITSACSNATDWWHAPPADNVEHIYGLGEGPTMALAQQQALADISGKLSTQISASLDRVTQDTGIAYNDTIRRQLHSNVNTTELSQFQIVKSRQQGNTVTVLLELDRKKLADIWRQQIADQTTRLTTLLQEKTINNFNQWLAINQALAGTAHLNALNVQLFALDGTRPATDLHHQLTRQLTTQPLGIKVLGNNPRFTRALQEQLNQPGLIHCRADCPLQISYEITAEHDSLFGEFVSDTTVLISIYERQRLISNSELTAQVTSVASYKSADEGSLNTIIKQLQQTGLWPLLGINL